MRSKRLWRNRLLCREKSKFRFGALKLKAKEEQAKVGEYDRSDAIAGLIDSLSDFLGEFDRENEPKGTSTEHLWATTDRRP